MPNRTISVFAAALVVCLCAASQNKPNTSAPQAGKAAPFAVYGNVYDFKTGAGIRGAKVTAGLRAFAITDQSGRYRVYPLDRGVQKMTVTVELPGYVFKPNRKDITPPGTGDCAIKWEGQKR